MKKYLIIVLLVLGVIGESCSNVATNNTEYLQDIASAKLAMYKYFKARSDFDYITVWNLTSQSARAKLQSVERCKEIVNHNILGKEISHRIYNTTDALNNTSGNPSVTFFVDSEYEHYAVGEEVLMVKENGQWKMDSCITDFNPE